MVLNSYLISCDNLYPILKEINKLAIPINQNNPKKWGIILPNLIYNYMHNFKYIYIYIQKTSNSKIQNSKTLP